jgi:hypothetical protein
VVVLDSSGGVLAIHRVEGAVTRPVRVIGEGSL